VRIEAIGAADALAKAKVESQIDFGAKTSLLSASDVQIATQLKGIYGNDVPAALNSSYAAQLRFNGAVKDGATEFQNAAGPALLDFETGAKSGSDAIKSFETQFARSILNMVNQMLIFAPIARALQSAFTFCSFTTAPTMGSDGLAAVHHTGGVVGGDSMPMRLIHPSGSEIPRWRHCGRRGPDYREARRGRVHARPNGGDGRQQRQRQYQCGKSQQFRCFGRSKEKLVWRYRSGGRRARYGERQPSQRLARQGHSIAVWRARPTVRGR
jgi:hypothetical protein